MEKGWGKGEKGVGREKWGGTEKKETDWLSYAGIEKP